MKETKLTDGLSILEPTVEELTQRIERLKLEKEIVTLQLEIAQLKMQITQLTPTITWTGGYTYTEPGTALK